MNKIPFSSFSVRLSNEAGPFLHSHEHHEIFLTTAGRGVQVTDAHTLEMRVNDCFFFAANCAHAAGCSQPEGFCDGIVLYLEDDIFAAHTYGDRDAARLLAGLCRFCQSQPQLPLSAAAAADSAADLSRILQLFRDRPLGYRCLSKAVFLQWLTTIAQAIAPLQACLHEEPDNAAYNRLDELLQILETRYMMPVSVAEAAAMAGMSRSQFHRHFHAYTGNTFVEYVNSFRIQKATEMLAKSRLSISQIAAACGFVSLSHFYRVFHRHAGGLTPRAAQQHR